MVFAPLCANKGSISIAGGAAAKGGGANGAFQKFRPRSLNGVEPNHLGRHLTITIPILYCTSRRLNGLTPNHAIIIKP